MIGAIIGDVVGSIYENHNIKTTDFPLLSRFSHFTDDTTLTVAIADAILLRKNGASNMQAIQAKKLYATKIKEYGRSFPDAGYGHMFQEWIKSDSLKGYGSYGNGSAMRASPIGFAFENIDDVLREAEMSAAVTHNHRDAIYGAQAVASAIYYARKGESKEYIRRFIEKRFKYNLNQRLDDIRPTYKFDNSCKGSVPQAMIVFLESTDFEDAIRKAVSLGGDSDTIASMAGGIAQAYYKKIPPDLVSQVQLRLDASLRQLIRAFESKYSVIY
jgi:ADP-ribosylglycohydrolase